MKVKKLVRKVLPKPAIKVAEKGYRKGRGVYYLAKFGFPARGMRVIAVTGTNGKSTTCAYINEILKAAGYKTAVLTTVFYEIAGKATPNKTHFTLSRQSIVQSFFALARTKDVDFVVLEVTSHALDQDRIMGTPVEIAVMTNFSQDHLDYHHTMEKYAEAKAKLFRNYGAKWAVLNADDPWYDDFRKQVVGKNYSYGKKQGLDAVLSSVKLFEKGSKAELICGKTKVHIKTHLLGEFNLYNASAAASVGRILGVEPKYIEKGIINLKGIHGRVEEIKTNRGFRVLIDFAITPDAIEKVLTSLQKITKGKVRIVFGATGDRDKAKRAIMGEVAAKHADFIYLTDDETYTENGDKIRRAVYAGIKVGKGTHKTKIIPDRGIAIKTALKEAQKGDTVLITGLGHEKQRNMGGKLIPWSDQEVVRRLLINRRV